MDDVGRQFIEENNKTDEQAKEFLQILKEKGFSVRSAYVVVRKMKSILKGMRENALRETPIE